MSDLVITMELREKGFVDMEVLTMTQDLTSGRDTGISLKCCDGALEPEL